MTRRIGTSRRKKVNKINSKEHLKTRWGLISALLALILVSFACSGQQDKKLQDDAVALAEQGALAVGQLEWNAYAKLIHPDDLTAFKAMLMPEIEKLMANAQTDTITIFDETFKLEQLQAFTGEEFFVEIIGTIFQLSTELATSFQNMKNDHLGAVVENDTLVHVVVHTGMKVGLKYVDEMNVTTVQRYDGGWRLRISPKIKGIGLMLQQSLQMQKR